MSVSLLRSKVPVTWAVFIGILSVFVSCIMMPVVTRAETVIAHAHIVWEITDMVVQENTTLRWEVEDADVWSFNPQLFPDGHTADGIPVEALKDYVAPGQPIGKLIGRIGDSGRKFPMGRSGAIHILPSEDGEFLYLTMNDDIIGLYGNGFQDNEGELMVKISQMREK